jgi:predicted nuclease of predicted toxin-antitoxin system
MKLLFDQNISYRIIKKIEAEFPLANQVQKMGLHNATDVQIWEYARDHSYAIVTFDADFVDLVTYKGHPPKIIWLRLGNMTTQNVADVLLKKSDLIKDFLVDKDFQEIACLEID